MMKLKVYYLPNWDGNNACMVTAQNQKEAVWYMRTTLGQFRSYGGQRITDEESPLWKIAMSETSMVWKKKIDCTQATPWLFAFEKETGQPAHLLAHTEARG